MTSVPPVISSLTNPRVKQVVALRRRAHRDALGLTIVEGYPEVKRAVDNRHVPVTLFTCPPLFQGENEPELIRRCLEAGAEHIACAEPVFRKMSYRDRPDGLLAVTPRVRGALADLRLPANPLLVVVQAIEKPGNLGTILRSSDAAGADAVLVCDRCTDINNPNVVRASIGTLFALPVIEAATAEVLPWLKARGIRTVAATPHAERLYTDENLRGPVALVLGAEQTGLTGVWMDSADVRVRIPMRGQADSLNVAQAATLLLFEAVRQRG
jgi:TrmH family RNA methyltransferase